MIFISTVRDLCRGGRRRCQPAKQGRQLRDERDYFCFLALGSLILQGSSVEEEQHMWVSCGLNIGKCRCFPTINGPKGNGSEERGDGSVSRDDQWQVSRMESNRSGVCVEQRLEYEVLPVHGFLLTSCQGLRLRSLLHPRERLKKGCDSGNSC